MKNYNKETENKLIEMVKEKEQSDRQLLTFEWIIGILSVLVLLIPVMIASYLPMEDWLRITLVIAGFIPALIGLGFALKIEQVAGYYECKECGHKYVPSFRSVLFAMHINRTRYMKCPHCHKKSWQKKVISKD